MDQRIINSRYIRFSEARAEMKARITTKPIRAECPNGPSTINRGEDAKLIFVEFVRSIEDHYDLQQQEGQHTPTAEGPSNQKVVAGTPRNLRPNS